MAIKTYQISVNQVNGVKMEIEARSHKIIVDEPLTAGGTDEGMNPVEIMLGSLGACQAITTAIFAKMYGIKIDGIRVEVEGDKDSDIRCRSECTPRLSEHPVPLLCEEQHAGRKDPSAVKHCRKEMPGRRLNQSWRTI